MAQQKIGIIGGGNMGAAIIAGARSAYDIRVAEKDLSRSQWLRRHLKVPVVTSEQICSEAKTLVLAVKPQNFEETLAELNPYLSAKHLVISIAAGITTRTIERRVPAGTRVVRAMPNLPAQVEQGVTALCAGKCAKATDMSSARRIFQKVGRVLEVKENQMDAVTAVSGSGPAYVFLFVESFIKAARKAGLDEVTSRQLIWQTMSGSFALLDGPSVDPAELRRQVTSKGGTTQAALDVFLKGELPKMFQTAVISAKRRSKELSR